MRDLLEDMKIAALLLEKKKVISKAKEKIQELSKDNSEEARKLVDRIEACIEHIRTYNVSSDEITEFKYLLICL